MCLILGVMLQLHGACLLSCLNLLVQKVQATKIQRRLQLDRQRQATCHQRLSLHLLIQQL